MKKGVFLLSFVLLISLISFASADKIEISLVKDTVVAGESLSMKASYLDSANNPLQKDIGIVIEDANQLVSIEKTISSNNIVEINLGEKVPAGYWKITAKSGEITSTAIFMVETNELVKFEIENTTLNVINVGNVRYTKTIQVVIGESIGSKMIDLGVGERTSFRLVAPEGTYNIKVTDGKTTFTQSSVALTGKAIGVLDNREASSSPVTTAIKGEETPYGEEQTSSPNRTIVYIFLFVVFGAAILLAIERRYKKSALGK
jgi:hypothetical protein